jgi:hypothetical protein
VLNRKVKKTVPLKVMHIWSNEVVVVSNAWCCQVDFNQNRTTRGIDVDPERFCIYVGMVPVMGNNVIFKYLFVRIQKHLSTTQPIVPQWTHT